MRTVLRSLVTTVALAAFAVPSLASAAGTATVPTRHLTAEGGTVKWPVAVHNAKTCSWSSSPSVAGFTTTVKCKSGRVERSFRFGANPLTKAKDYTLSLTVRGKATTVDHLKVVEAGRTTPTTTTVPPTTTTTSSTTSTTTTTVTTTPPPPASPGLTSPNWSGYVLTGASGGYQAISAKWTVPAVDCSSLQNSETSDWVGVNGWLGADWGGLFQDGTTSYCFNGQQGDYAWWTDAAASYSAPTLFAVAPGDVIDAEVYQDSSGYWDVQHRRSHQWAVFVIRRVLLWSWHIRRVDSRGYRRSEHRTALSARGLRVGDLHGPRLDGAVRLLDSAPLFRCNRDGGARQIGRGVA